MTGRDGAGAAYGAWDGEVSHDSGVTRLREVVSAEDREEVEAVVGQYLHIDRAVDYATRQLGRQPEPGRVDRRDARTYLIDDPGSRAEDAITVQQTMDGGYDLEMHIIDIPFLLEPGGYVDRHAAARGRTVYSDDGVHPLFPGELRDGPFCFRAGADRPANTVRFRFDSAVDLVDVSVYRSAVQPDTRLSFDEAADLLHRSKTDVGRGEADCITDLEHLKVATLSLVDELPWEPESPWSMEATVEVVGSAVNRHLADTLAQRGRGLFRNQGLRDTDWPSHLEAYLRAEGVEVEHGRLATADDPVRTLDRLYWETENELVGGIYRMVRARRESLEEQRSSPDGGPLAVPQKADSPAWYAPVPFGHEDQEANAYARFTRPANNYSNIVNWRAVLEEELLSPVPLHSVAENLNQV